MKIIDYNEFKNLEIVHVFEFYDKPLYYISKSAQEDYFLFYFIDDDPGKSSEWFTSKITNNEIQKILYQQVGALEFLNLLLTKKRLYRISIHGTGDRDIDILEQEVTKSNLLLDEFPDENFYAEYDYISDKELTYVAPSPSLIEKFKVILKDAHNSHNVSLDFLVKNLNYISSSVNSLHKDQIHNEFGQAETVEDDIDIDVLAFQPSSFGVWFEVKNNDDADLFKVGAKSVDSLFNVIQTVNEKTPKQLRDDIFIEGKYSINSLKIINSYLKEIKDKDYSLSLEASSTSEDGRTQEVMVTFNKDSYYALQKIESILISESNESIEEEVISGTLTSVNTKRNGFWLSLSDGPDIRGTFESNLFTKIKNAGDYSIKVPSNIKATLIKNTINNHLSDEYTVKYSLKSFEYIKKE